jgi:hypothetical protein
MSSYTSYSSDNQPQPPPSTNNDDQLDMSSQDGNSSAQTGDKDFSTSNNDNSAGNDDEPASNDERKLDPSKSKDTVLTSLKVLSLCSWLAGSGKTLGTKELDETQALLARMKARIAASKAAEGGGGPDASSS